MRNEDPIVYNHFLFQSLTVEERGILRVIGDKGGRYDIHSLAYTHVYTVDEIADTVSSMQEKGLCELTISSRKNGQAKEIVMNVALTDRGISFFNIDLGMLTGR